MRDIRISITIIIALLISVGITMIYSSSCVYALKELGQANYFLKRHLLFLAIGLVLTLMIMVMDYRDLQRWAKPLMLFSLFLLVLVLIPQVGKASFGARRWFKIGPFNFQPSEFTKMAVLIYIADYLARKGNKIHHFIKGFFPLILVMVTICCLIVKQPDFGNSLLVASMFLILMFIAGARILHMGLLGLLSLPVLYFLVVKVPYRWIRIKTFLDPWQDSQGAGFQLAQSQIALGSGGVYGLGLGKSIQKLFYLPAAHTDFILSIIGEELGLLGTLAIVLLFVAFIWQGARIVKRTTDPFGYFLSIGIILMIGLQAVVNIGVSIGAFPTKGLPLPFISYGGSALIFNMMSVGLLLNISRIADQ